jgi:hypothetical protein
VGAGGAQERAFGRSRSYLSQTELPLTFGLGESDRIDRLEVTWPDGSSRTMTDVAVDREIVVRPPGGG